MKKWFDIEDAPVDDDIILQDEKGFVYVGAYCHRYGYFARYTYNGLEEHQHAAKWMPLPKAEVKK